MTGVLDLRITQPDRGDLSADVWSLSLAARVAVAHGRRELAEGLRGLERDLRQEMAAVGAR